MWKRIASAALRGLIAKLIWQTEKLLKVLCCWFSLLLTMSWCFSSLSLQPPCYPVPSFSASYVQLPTTLLLWLLLFGWGLVVVPGAPIPWDACGLGISTVFLVLFPSTDASEEYLGSLMYFFSSSLHMYMNLRSMKRSWKPKSWTVISRSSCSLWNQSVSLTSLVFHHFHFLPVHLHIFQH